MTDRRRFLQLAALAAAAATRSTLAAPAATPRIRISLAQWSLNKSFFGKEGHEKKDPLTFAQIAADLGIEGLEYVNQFYMDKAQDQSYLAEMKKRAADAGVKNLLIMCDREGNLGDPDNGKRAQTVQNHLKWLDAAATLGCHCIRVNAASNPKLPADEQMKLAADGLHSLCLEAEKRSLNVLVENHGGLSSNGKWLTAVMKAADHPRVGILPDFGNFYTNRDTGELYNPYLGVREFMPWVKGAMSAKAYDWDTGAGELYTEDRREGREMTLDYLRLFKIVLGSGYSGFVGIEHEGQKHSEIEGIKLTKQAIEKAVAAIG
ncbi:MAG: sugar phosphate isomerase/epimerase [Verrucomicrobiaceae bacterium]|nr:sugar phosphate isomerase/epimerase [Verrucomicrobiaceae bacterium]